MKIKNREALFLTVNFMTVKIFTSSLEIITNMGKNAAWLLFSINTAVSILMFLVIYALYKKSGSRDIFTCLPSFFKKAAGLLSACYFIVSASLILGILIKGVIRGFMPESPRLFISVFFVAALIFAVKSGIENVISLSVGITPVLSFVILVSVMLLPYSDFTNLFPVFSENNFYLSGIFFLNFFSDFFLFILMMPYLEDREKTLKTGLWAIVITFLISLVVILSSTLTIPHKAGFFSPFYYMVSFLTGSRSAVNFVKILKLCFLLNFFLYFSTAVSFSVESLKRSFSLKYEKELTLLMSSFLLLLLTPIADTDMLLLYEGLMKYSFILFPALPLLIYLFARKEKSAK